MVPLRQQAPVDIPPGVLVNKKLMYRIILRIRRNERMWLLYGYFVLLRHNFYTVSLERALQTFGQPR
jgi:hypothetical protein